MLFWQPDERFSREIGNVINHRVTNTSAWVHQPAHLASCRVAELDFDLPVQIILALFLISAHFQPVEP